MEEIQGKTERRRAGKSGTRMRRMALNTGCLAMITANLLLPGCNRTKVPLNPEDYVEIDNPLNEGNPAENSRIWVPKSSVNNGLPRGIALVGKGYDKLTAGKEIPAPSGDTTNTLRHRLLLVDEDGSPVGKQFREIIRSSCIIRPLQKQQAQPSASAEEKLALVADAATQPGSGPVLLLSFSDADQTGAVIKADLYDSRGPVLVRSLTVKVPVPEKGETREEALQRAVSGLAVAVQDTLSRALWYAKVVGLSGERIYVDAGLEAGLKQGQRLKVYRGGEVVKGLGFAPGNSITTFTLTDYVGPDGSFGVSADAAKVQPGDFVEMEK